MLLVKLTLSQVDMCLLYKTIYQLLEHTTKIGTNVIMRYVTVINTT